MFGFHNVTFGIPVYIAFGLQPNSKTFTFNKTCLNVNDTEFIKIAMYADQLVVNASTITTQHQFNILYEYLQTKVIRANQIQFLYNGIATTKDNITNLLES